LLTFAVSLNEKLLEKSMPTLTDEPIRAVERTVQTRDAVAGRMTTDRLVNVFLQEFAPVFPILRSSTILALYEDYVGAGQSKEAKALAQLNLVFAIAGLSSQVSTLESTILTYPV
jgi:hypothetical protein